MINQHNITVSRTARIVTKGEIKENTKYIWIICHGYGQLAYYFIQKFNLSDEHYFVAPEALSRFYLGDDYQKVGASWMTKEDRENDIKDYLAYLDNVYINFISPNLNGLTKVIALGFSQGCNTISRWAAHTDFQIDKIVLCGGAPANELWNGDLLKKYDAIFSVGKEDLFFKDKNIEEIALKVSLLFKKMTTSIHEGGHILDELVLKSIVKQL